MVLADLGARLHTALGQLSKASVVDDKVREPVPRVSLADFDRSSMLFLRSSVLPCSNQMSTSSWFPN